MVTKPVAAPAPAAPAPAAPHPYAQLGAALATLAALPPGTVCVLVPGNPKHPKSLAAERFALYSPGITVAAYRTKCLGTGQLNAKRNAAADIVWDKRHGFINVVPPAAAAQ